MSGTVFVFAPDPLLTVTVEAGPGGDEIHLHPGGQGFWAARMAHALGAVVTLGGPFGGESGAVVRALMADTGLQVAAVSVGATNGAYVHDRRDGERRQVAAMRPETLTRHDIDDFYTTALTGALEADVTILAGPGAWDPPLLPSEIYRRLAGDLRSMGRTVVADLSGDVLAEALAGGLSLVKVSHEELERDGLATPGDTASLLSAMTELTKTGADNVVVSRAGDPAFALIDGRLVSVTGPSLDVVDHRGAGDSMTAGLAVGIAAGLDLAEALRLGAAAGALNVTRHGLASGERSAIQRLAEQFELHDLNPEAAT
ncbi:PfkB family carbohydrate kinase [Sporichthya polymorpha]|uniref:PfkB family carbohydrate kinase n=1 Tax=Sporichthya polymorpha TaxID=35751 RepID=UPI000360491F|nr:PfkB family carbohydrate kinase [Sporichthya polymorpha]